MNASLNDDVQTVETVCTILKNAERLLSDARLLAKNGSYRTATSLAILSAEECGKACLVNWRIKGLISENISNAMLGHIDKQRIFRSYLVVAAISKFGDIVLKDDPRAHLALDITSKEFLEPFAAEFEKQTKYNIVLVDSGTVEYMKQNGFYADVTDNGGVVSSLIPLTEENFKFAEEMAVEHLDMARADDDVHTIAARVYNADIWPKLNKGQRSNVFKAMFGI